MLAKVKRALLIVWAVLSALAAVAAVALFGKNRRAFQNRIRGDAENARKETKEKIENTPASELVADSGNADALRRERESIAERFRHEVQLRVEQKLHGEGSSGTP